MDNKNYRKRNGRDLNNNRKNTNNKNTINPNDPYAIQYEQQLREYERMANQGHDYDYDDYDYDYYDQYDEEYDGQPYQNYNQRNRPPQSRNSRPAQRNTHSNNNRSHTRNQNGHQKPKQQQSHKKQNPNNAQKRRNDLQFGGNNTYRRTPVKKKKHPIKNFFKFLFTLVIILAVVFNALLIRYICSVKQVNTDNRENSNKPMLQGSYVRNILIIGSDSRDSKNNGRTDSMILLSINSKSKEINMTSFMRDMYVEIKGLDSDGNPYDSWGKLNSAYVSGGAGLLMDTLEYNFDIKIDDYVYIDFFSFVDIVDALGGIELTVSDEEAKGMIPPMAEQNKIMGKAHGTDYLNHGGTMVMNGNQALAYARLRYVGNADFQRTERQREVMSKIIEKALHSNPLVIDKFAKTTASNLTTNMSRADMFLLSYKLLFSLNYKTNSDLRVPPEGSYGYGNHDGQSTLDVDVEKCRDYLQNNLYREHQSDDD